MYGYFLPDSARVARAAFESGYFAYRRDGVSVYAEIDDSIGM